MTRQEIQDLRAAGKNYELVSRLGKRIAFGTAGALQSGDKVQRPELRLAISGLRARMEAGYARMNDVTVIQASQARALMLSREMMLMLSTGVVSIRARAAAKSK